MDLPAGGRGPAAPAAPPPQDVARPTAPRFARPLERAVAALDALLDRAYGSRWNPAHQTGGLAVALMLIAVASGVYLLFVYRIGAPYESMQAMQAQVAGGRWLRALHRYASDLAVAAVALHALRMLAEGRTWGPRVLAWVTGLLLTAAMLVVGWTGYVLVWDDHGRILGAAGARLLDSLHILSAPVGRIFDGGTAPLAPFFFMNLFVHMALPLAMTLLLWLHTMRLARSRWLPDRRVWAAVTVALTALSLAWPATLGPAADGLTLGDRAAYDVFYTAWIPLSVRLPAPLAWASTLALALLPLTLPVWWRPRRERRAAPSHHNPLACTGCGQCVVDCPFEAIRMVPNTTGRGAHLEVAFVETARCVSCGLCSGSCDQLAIGPPGRDGHAQTLAARPLVAAADPHAFVLAHCAHDGVGGALAARMRAAGVTVREWPVDCVGSLHALPVQQLALAWRGVFVLGCPAGRCRSREGVPLALGRLLQGREPFLKRPLDATRVRFASGGRADLPELEREFRRFAATVGSSAASAGFEAGGRRGWRGALAGTLVTALLLAGTATLSQWPAGATPPHAALRLAWRLPGQSWLDCRPLSVEEIARLPAHMRKTEDCRTVYLHYRLQVWMDGDALVDREVAPLGARGDRPLYVDEDLPVEPGTHHVRISFTPLADPRGVGLSLVLEDSLEWSAGRARIVRYDTDRRRLVAR